MRTCTVVALAVALALAGCKKEEKGASSDKKDDTKEEPAKKDEPAVKEDKPADDKATTPPPETKKDEPVAEPTTPEAPIPTAAPVVAEDSITLGFSPPPVGAKYTEEQVQTMDIKISVQGQTIPMQGEKLEKKMVEVLEVGADAVTKAKYTYEKHSDVQTMGGKSKGGPSPIEGKTYTLTAGNPIAVDTDAGPAPDAEAAVVREAEDKFGKSDRMAKVLAGKKFVKDQAVELSGEEVQQAMGDDDMKVGKITLTYRGMDGDLAKFDIAMQMGGSKDGNDISIDMTGKAMVDPKMGEMIALDVTGTFKMTGQATADGTMAMKGQRTR